MSERIKFSHRSLARMSARTVEDTVSGYWEASVTDKGEMIFVGFATDGEPVAEHRIPADSFLWAETHKVEDGNEPAEKPATESEAAGGTPMPADRR